MNKALSAKVARLLLEHGVDGAVLAAQLRVLSKGASYAAGCTLDNIADALEPLPQPDIDPLSTPERGRRVIRSTKNLGG